MTQQDDAREQHQVPSRQHTQPFWMQDYVTGEGLSDDDYESHLTLSNDNDPVHYDEAAKNPIWRKAMQEEIDAIERNDTWYLTELPAGAKKIGVKRLVGRYTQEYGVDYKEVFAPMARMETI